MCDHSPYDLRNVPGVFRACKKPIPMRVVFAPEDGTLQTREGPVAYQRGDAILTGTEGERWPIQREKFDATYQPTAEAGIYTKRPMDVLAWVTPKPLDIDLPDGRGSLHAEPGDVIVQYAPGDQFVVSASIFARTYERRPEDSAPPA